MLLRRANLKSGLPLAAVAISALLMTAAGEGRSAFDARWSVEAVASPLEFSDKFAGALWVANGQISGTVLGAIAKGSVADSGKVTLEVNLVHVSGSLATNSGLGHWNSPTCAGTWAANRI